MHIQVDQGFESSHKLHRYNKLSAETVRQLNNHQGNRSALRMAGFIFGKERSKTKVNTKHTRTGKTVKENSCRGKNLLSKKIQTVTMCLLLFVCQFELFSRSAGSLSFFDSYCMWSSWIRAWKRGDNLESTEAGLQRCRIERRKKTDEPEN